MTRGWIGLCCTSVICAFLFAYAADAGGGFIKDDADWVVRSRLGSPSDLSRLFTDTGGFFRPTVALTFAANWASFGPDPRGYGYTNLLLGVACGVAIGWLARALGFSAASCFVAASVWILNPHGISWALLWLSGRTALLLVLFAVLAAIAALRGRPLLAGLFSLLAMLSKEEAVLLPVPLLTATLLFRARDGARLLSSLLPLAALLIYLVLRAQSDAMTPATAPAYYRFTTDPAHVWRNLLEYGDRALTFAAAASALAWVAVRRAPALGENDRRILAFGGIWLLSGYAITLFLPVRSSLYALYPSVGAAIASALLIERLWATVSARQKRLLTGLAAVVPMAMIPLLQARNGRWTELARVSHATLEAVGRLPQDATDVVILDDRRSRANVESAVGGALPSLIELSTGHRRRVWLAPAPAGTPDAQVVPMPSGVRHALKFDGTDVQLLPATAISGSAILYK